MEGWEWTTEARLITSRRCRLKAVVITPSSASSSCTIYNGTSTSDPVVLTIVTQHKNSRHFNFGDGLILQRGLFVGGFSSVTGVLVKWENV